MRPTDDRKFATFTGAAPVYEAAQPSPTAGAAGTTLDAIRRLTPRQREVLAVMMQGKCNKAICRSLNLAEPTVKNHVTAILKALNATNRTEAVIKFARALAAPSSYTYTVSGYSTFLNGSHLLVSAVNHASSEGEGAPVIRPMAFAR